MFVFLCGFLHECIAYVSLVTRMSRINVVRVPDCLNVVFPFEYADWASSAAFWLLRAG